MDSNELRRLSFPLLNLFLDLEKAGLKLSISDYENLLRCLESGYYISSKEELLYLCKTLWAKSKTQSNIVENIFWETLGENEKIRPLIGSLPIIQYSNNIPFKRLEKDGKLLEIDIQKVHLIPLIESQKNRKSRKFWISTRVCFTIFFIVLFFLILVFLFRERFISNAKEIYWCIGSFLLAYIVVFESTFIAENLSKVKLIDARYLRKRQVATHALRLTKKDFYHAAKKSFKELNGKAKEDAASLFERAYSNIRSQKTLIYRLTGFFFRNFLNYLPIFSAFILILGIVLVFLGAWLNAATLILISFFSLLLYLARDDSGYPIIAKFKDNHKNPQKSNLSDQESIKEDEAKENWPNSILSDPIQIHENSFDESDYQDRIILDDLVGDDKKEITRKQALEETFKFSKNPPFQNKDFEYPNSYSSITQDKKESYILNVNPFPIRRRQIQQTFRTLRRASRSGKKTVVDLDSTINKIAQERIFTRVVMKSVRLNQVEIIFMIDVSESMVAFSRLPKMLFDSAKEGGKLGKVSAYFFQNFPDTYIYEDSYFQNSVPIKSITNTISSNGLRSTIVIISDAGSARGSINDFRIFRTKSVLSEFSKKTNKIVWLNPLPKSRWNNTSAQFIGELVPMFEINSQGLVDAVNKLRGESSLIK
jgi:uncharacterized protein with von Willebrand factor type A (vWA) domain